MTDTSALNRRLSKAKLINHHPDSLRNDPDLRQDTAAEAQKIMDLMGSFMGAN